MDNFLISSIEELLFNQLEGLPEIKL
jgi:hypothetical protein